MTQVEKLKQAVSLISQAMEVYASASKELEEKTGRVLHLEQTNTEVEADELTEHFSRLIGHCVLAEI